MASTSRTVHGQILANAGLAKDLAIWRNYCGNFGYLQNDALEGSRIPYQDIIMSEDSIKISDVIKTAGRCWSKTSLYRWLRTFIDKTSPPKNPATGESFTIKDLNDAKVDYGAFRHFNPSNYQRQPFEIPQIKGKKLGPTAIKIMKSGQPDSHYTGRAETFIVDSGDNVNLMAGNKSPRVESVDFDDLSQSESLELDDQSDEPSPRLQQLANILTSMKKK